MLKLVSSKKKKWFVEDWILCQGQRHDRGVGEHAEIVGDVTAKWGMIPGQWKNCGVEGDISIWS